MLTCLQKEEHVVITFAKTEEVTRKLNPNGNPIGLDIVYLASKNTMLVKKILDNGTAKEWNDKAGDDEKIKVPSLIVGVDGVRGNAQEMLANLQKGNASIELT